MAGGRRRLRHDLRVPHRPWVGPRRPLPPGPRPPRHLLRPRGWLPARRHRVRRAVLRDLAPRGAGDGPAATSPAADHVGDDRAGGHRPDRTARHQRGRLRGGHLLRVRARPALDPRGHRRAPAGGLAHQHRLRAHRLLARARRTRRHDRHGLLVVAGRPAPGDPVAAATRVHAGRGGRRDRTAHADGVHRVLAAAGTGRRRPVQAVRGSRGRDGLGGGRRDGARGAPVRRAAQRASRVGGDPGFGGEPGRRVQRFDGAERTVAAAGDPSGAGQQRPPGVRGGCRRGARHGNDTRRPDRGAGHPRHLRAGAREAAVSGLAEVQHRAHAGRRGCRGRDEDGHGHATRCGAEDVARRRADARGGLVGRVGGAGDRGAAVARGCASGRCVVVRDERHQRARGVGTGACGGTGAGGSGGAGRVAAGGAVGAVGPHAGGAAGTGRARAGPAGGGRAPGRRGVVVGHDPGPVRAPGGGAGLTARRLPAWPAGAGHRRRLRVWCAWCGTGLVRRSRVGVPRSGCSVGRHGHGAGGVVGGVRGPDAGVCGRARPTCRLVVVRRPERRGVVGAGRRGAARALGGDGLPGGVVAVVRCGARRRGRALAG